MTDDRRPLRVLIVEDDEGLLLAVKDILEDTEYESKVVGDGHAAIQAVSLFAPDVIVLDLILPFMSGFEFLEWLNARELRIPVVLATNDDNYKASELGATMTLSKPYTAEGLLDAIAAALGTRE